MGLFFVYILKSSLCLALFYLFNRLLLSRETFHRFNRFALLGTLLFSCLLPLAEVSVQQDTEAHQTMMTLEQWLLPADAMSLVEVQTPEVAITWSQVALLLYLIGILFFFFRNIYSLSRMLVLLKSGRRECMDKYVCGKKRVTLIVHNREIAPFSWMKYIVISQKDLEENGHEILIHELAHIHNRHSLDLLLADICILFQWFNPASWLLKQELQNIHEYEADETVIKKGVDAKQYQLLLIKKAVGTRLYSMANSFNHSKLKKRITMMLKEKSSPWARLKYLYVLPLAAVAVTAFARPEVSKQVEDISRMSDALGREQVNLLFSSFHDISAAKVNDFAAIVETKEAESIHTAPEAPQTNVLQGDTTKPAEVKYVPSMVSDKLNGTLLEVAEQMPEFPGGVAGFMKYLQENMRYPESAKKAGMQGRVTVRFVIDKDGSVKNPHVIRSIDDELDAEAIRLVKASPKWKPGKQKGEDVAVQYAIPVVFKLDGGQDKITIRTPKDVDLLYIIDGKEVSPSIMAAINPDAIEGMTVLKDDAAIKIYGEKAKNGVLLITLKKDRPAAKVIKGTLKNSTTVSTTITGNKDGLIGSIGGIYMNGNKTDLEGATIYIDKEKIDLKGRTINEVIPANQIENVSVGKSTSVGNAETAGSAEIHITTKKNAKASELTSAKGNMKVEGYVKNAQGNPVVGASVVIDGAFTGTITSNDGRFLLSVPDKESVLLVSYIGMQTVKVTVQPKMTIVLKDE